MEGLVQCSANYIPLTSINHLERAAVVHGDKTSIVYGNNFKCSWRQTYHRCQSLASALTQLGISRGDIVHAALVQGGESTDSLCNEWFKMKIFPPSKDADKKQGGPAAPGNTGSEQGTSCWPLSKWFKKDSKN